jgi:hypothetical protein
MTTENSVATEAEWAAQSESATLAIVVELSGEMEQVAQEAWKILAEALDIQFTLTHCPRPHITLVKDFVGSHKHVIKSLTSFSHYQRCVDLYAKGLSVEVEDSPVINIRWRMNQGFQNLYANVNLLLQELDANGVIEDYEADYDWEAKTILADHDSTYDTLTNALSLIREFDFNQLLHINSLALYEHCDELGERLIERFSLIDG